MKQRKYELISIALVVVSILSSCLIFVDDTRPNSYLLLWFLPLVFAVCMLLVIITKKSEAMFKNLASASLVALFFLRNVFTPLIMRYGNYASYFSVSDTTDAVFLMSYEMIVCFVVILLSVKRTETIGINIRTDSAYYGQTSLLFRIVFFTIVTFMIAAFVAIPSISKMYVSVVNYGGTLETETVESLSAVYANRPLITLFTLFADFMRVMIPAFLFLIIRRVIRNSVFSFIFCLLIVFCQFLFISQTSALAILSAMVNLLVLYKLYFSKRKMILVLTVIGGTAGVLLISIFKLENDVLYSGTFMETLSKSLQAYLTGISNVSAGFNMPSEEKFSHLFYDFYYAIPFNNSLFGLSGSTSANIFNSSNFGKFQIIACLSQSYYYFGPLFAPIISVLFTYFGIKVCEKNKKEKNIWMYTSKTLLWIYLIISIVMYNGQIFMVRFTNTILPCLLLSFFSKVLLRKDCFYEKNRRFGAQGHPASHFR